MTVCQHPIEVQSTDLATGDLFCGDCGNLVQAYKNQPTRLAGDDAAKVIGRSLSGTGRGGYVVVNGIQNIGPHKFWVTVRIMDGDTASWETFTVVRAAGDKLQVQEGTA